MKQLTEMEQILQEQTQLLEELQNSLAAFENSRADYRRLMDYYGSERYLEDVDRFQAGQLEAGSYSVLTEDAVYDYFKERRKVLFEIMEISIQSLKDDE